MSAQLTTLATSLAVDSDQIGKIGIGVIIAVVVIGIVLSTIITKVVVRAIVLVVMVGLALFVWQQRATIQDRVKNCQLQMSFFGIDVHAPASVVQKCNEIQQRPPK